MKHYLVVLAQRHTFPGRTAVSLPIFLEGVHQFVHLFDGFETRRGRTAVVFGCVYVQTTTAFPLSTSYWRHTLNLFSSFQLFGQSSILFQFILIHIFPTSLLIFLQIFMRHLQSRINFRQLILLFLQLSNLPLHKFQDGFTVKTGHLFSIKLNYKTKAEIYKLMHRFAV